MRSDLHSPPAQSNIYRHANRTSTVGATRRLATAPLVVGFNLPTRRHLTDRYAMTVGLVLKIALGLVCFVIGAASLIGAISSFLFVSASDAHIPARDRIRTSVGVLVNQDISRSSPKPVQLASGGTLLASLWQLGTCKQCRNRPEFHRSFQDLGEACNRFFRYRPIASNRPFSPDL